jgi:hypothetical protein
MIVKGGDSKKEETAVIRQHMWLWQDTEVAVGTKSRAESPTHE